MSEPQTAAEVARALADVLDRHGIPYAVGGAINVFVSPTDQLSAALAVLAEAGFLVHEDEPALRARAIAEGQFQGSIGGLRVDVFVPAIFVRQKLIELVGAKDERLAALDENEQDLTGGC